MLLVATTFGQERLTIDSLSNVRYNNSISGLAKNTPEVHYDAAIHYNRDDVAQPNLMNNISSIPGDILTTSKDFFSTQNIPMLSLVAGSTTSLYTQDQRLYQATYKLHAKSKRFRTITKYGVAFGDGKWQLAGAAVMGLYGYASDDNRLVKTSFEITEAIASTGVAIQLLKHSIGRESPGSYSKAGGKFHPFPSIREYSKNQAHYYSFPSGHTATAVTALTVISENYPDVYWIRPASYCAVACLGASLVSKNMHWYSDLPLAAMIGYSFGKTITNRSASQDNVAASSEKSVEVSLLPSVNYKSAGMSLIMSF